MNHTPDFLIAPTIRPVLQSLFTRRGEIPQASDASLIDQYDHVFFFRGVIAITVLRRSIAFSMRDFTREIHAPLRGATKMAGHGGLEPPTRELTVRCSTD